MGCSANKPRRDSVIRAKIKFDRTNIPSGDEAQYEITSKQHLLKRTQSERERSSALGTSLGNSPDTGKELQAPAIVQKIKENISVVILPPKDGNNQDFSFKEGTDSFVGKEKETHSNSSLNPSFINRSDVHLRSDERNLTASFPKATSLVVENRSSEKNPILMDISNCSFRNSIVVDTKGRDTSEAGSVPKNAMDMAGSTFSFMNLKFDNSSQPNVFFSENNNKAMNHIQTEKAAPSTFMGRSFGFGLKIPEAEKLQESQDKRVISLSESSVSSIDCSSTLRGNHEARDTSKMSNDTRELDTSKNPSSLNNLDAPPQQPLKTKAVGLSSQIIASSTNVGSVGTVTSLANICKDEVKKNAITKKFTRNLVDLLKSPSPINKLPGSLPLVAAKSMQQLGEAYEDINNKNSLPKLSKGGSVASSLQLKSQTKISSVQKIDMRVNLLSLPNEDDEEEDVEDLILKIGTSDENKDQLFNERSFDIPNFEIEEDSDGPSPIAQNSIPNITRADTPKTLILSARNSSFSRQVESSTFFDKTIYNLEDNITRLDLDKYSIYEYIDNVEIDERSYLNGLDQTQDNGTATRKANTSLYQGNISPIPKIKSAIFDTPESGFPSITTPHKNMEERLRMRPKSISEVDKEKFTDTTNQTSSPYLSPSMIPMTSLTNIPRERFARQKGLYKTTSQVIQTSQVDKSVDDEGQKKINQYLLIKDLGRGSFGKVKLALHCETKEQYAVKIANKRRLKKKLLSKSKSAFNQLATEIAIMKKMDHPNVVNLVEVIDDPNNDNLYIAMDFMKKGSVLSKSYWRHELAKIQEFNLNDEDSENLKRNRLSEAKAKKYFRHLISALDYLHNTVEVVHRDIKPENLLIGDDDILKVSDFGISKILEDGCDMLDTNAGTKLYLAPESWKGKSFRGKPADIWAAGGTLYYFLVGRPPFQGLSVDDVRRKIVEEDIIFPLDLKLNPDVVSLIKACLIKNPDERITLKEIMKDKWLTDNGKNPFEQSTYASVTLSDDDINKALTKISFMAVVMVTAKVKRKAHIARKNLERKRTQERIPSPPQENLKRE